MAFMNHPTNKRNYKSSKTFNRIQTFESEFSLISNKLEWTQGIKEFSIKNRIRTLRQGKWISIKINISFIIIIIILKNSKRYFHNLINSEIISMIWVMKIKLPKYLNTHIQEFNNQEYPNLSNSKEMSMIFTIMEKEIEICWCQVSN